MEEYVERIQSDVEGGGRKDSKRTKSSYNTALNRFELCCDPQDSGDLTSENLAKFASECMADELAPTTIDSYLTHLAPLWKCCLSWKLIPEIPIAKAPRVIASAKGRPLSREEFERFLAAINKVIKDKEAAKLWKQDAEMLWFSGLRLSDAVALHWGGGVELSIRGIDRAQPMLWVPAGYDKSRKESLIPLTPDFVAFLRTDVPHREGHVFRFVGRRGRLSRTDTLSKKFSSFGKAANIVAGETHQGDTIFASAHDLRRSFGNRWASEIEATDLMKLMRHKKHHHHDDLLRGCQRPSHGRKAQPSLDP